MAVLYNRGPYIPRCAELQRIVGIYGDIETSVKHKDILKCSMTRHFTSCYRPNGMYKEMPVLMCYDPRFAIIFKRDRSGQFQSRVFIQWTHDVYSDECSYCIGDYSPIGAWRRYINTQPIIPGIKIGKQYGTCETFSQKVIDVCSSLKLKFKHTNEDFYLGGLFSTVVNPYAHRSRAV